MASSLVITCQLGQTQASAQQRYQFSGKPKVQAQALRQLFTDLASGQHVGTVDVATGAAAPVAAAGAIAITYASVANNDTLTILGVTLTCVTGTPTADQFKKLTNATVTGDNLVAAILANATLAKYVTASNVSGTVTVTVKQKGSIGNVLAALATSNGTGFGLTQWTGGTGGAEETVVSNALGL